MNIKELKTALQRLESLYSAAGATTAVKGLRSVTQLLDGHEGMSVEEFIRETNDILARASNPKSTRLEAERVARHAGRLLAAGIDQNAFDAALQELDGDGSVGKLEWAAIANRYRNTPTNGTYVFKFKSSKDARAAIRDTFIERHEANSKRGIINQLTRWAS